MMPTRPAMKWKDPAIISITEQLFTRVDVAGELEALLPEDFSGLAGPIAGALRGPATDGVERILESDQFAALWERANRAADYRKLGVSSRGEAVELARSVGCWRAAWTSRTTTELSHSAFRPPRRAARGALSRRSSSAPP
jgi:hypothetical protein